MINSKFINYTHNLFYDSLMLQLFLIISKIINYFVFFKFNIQYINIISNIFYFIDISFYFNNLNFKNF